MPRLKKGAKYFVRTVLHKRYHPKVASYLSCHHTTFTGKKRVNGEWEFHFEGLKPLHAADIREIAAR